MEDIEENIMNKIYRSSGIGLAAFLGGPLAAGYLLFKNYKAFDKEESAKSALAISAFITTVFFVVMFSLPAGIIDKIPNFLFPIIFLWLGRWVAERTQKEDAAYFVENGGDFYSNWRAAGVSIVVTLAAVIGVVLIYSFIDALFLA